MKIVFDAFWWGGGPPSLRHVMREIVLMWAKRYPLDELVLVTRTKHHAASRDDIPANATVHESAVWPQAFFAAGTAARIARQEDADAIVTHNFAPRSPDRVSAIYLHDVLFETNPEMFTPLELRYFALMTRWVRHADLVFTSSYSEADRIRQNTHARRVIPVGLGLSEELIQPGALEERHPGLTADSYLLTVGRLNVRKNLERTLDAAIASGVLSVTFPLVVVGSPGGKEVELSAPVREAIADGRIVFTGFVSEARLRWLYRNTALFMFLSLGEGFGMPPVEAAHFGAPVLASDLAVLRENLGARARYVDPTDTEAIRDAILRCLNFPAPQVPLVDGDSLASQHNWAASVDAMRTAVVAARLAQTSRVSA